jgi:fatty-acyl-CoA synthase
MKGLMQDWPLVISSILDHAAREHPQQEIVTNAVEGTIRRCHYRGLHSRARKVAKALVSAGIKPGDRIATMAWNTDRHMEVWYGITGVGAIYHTLNPRLFAEQIEYIVNHAEDRIIFVDATFLPVLEPIRDKLSSVEKIIVLTDEDHLPSTSLNVEIYENWLARVDDDIEWLKVDEAAAAGLCYTSGTTGNPKGVLYSHRSNVLHALAVNQADVFGLRAVDSVMPVVPMFHANAWGLAFACPAVGAKIVMPGAKLDGESLFELLLSEHVTLTAAVPTLWMLLLEHMETIGGKLPDLARVVIGGAACPQVMIEKFEREYGIEVAHAWGMTEMSPVGTMATFKPQMPMDNWKETLKYKSKQGRVPYSVEMKIVNDENQELPRDGKAFGKLKVRGPGIAKSYFRQEGDTLDENGWFDTGDVATIDEFGFMQITDRAKDVIKSGGEWISSIEIENIAMGHPEVKEAAVIGIPHPKWDERPLLIVVPTEGLSPEKESILHFLRGKIAKWWIPDNVAFVETLPHTATGKLNKLELRKQFEGYQLAD